MEGRWTIWVATHGSVSLHKVFNGDAPTPVVPCDDAAIERGVNAIIMLAPGGSLPDAPYEVQRDLVESILEAAGKTP